VGLNEVVPFISKEGNSYRIVFSEITIELPIPIGVALVELAIISNNNRVVNNPATLFEFSSIINEYLNKNDIILYCYCDTQDLNMGRNNSHLSPQEFRSKLFSSMFDRRKDKSFVNKSIVIDDNLYGTHFIHLISKLSNENDINRLSQELLRMQK